MPKTVTATARRDWFKITDLAANNTAEIRLYGYIGESNRDQPDWWTGEMVESEGAGTVKEFQRELDALGSVKNLRLIIASEGGNVWDALAIHNMLARHAATITCIIDGFAFSAATLVAMSADSIEMPRNALMMIHNATWLAMGNKKDFQAAVDSLEVVDMAIAKSYAGKSGKKPEDFLPLMEVETWMDGDEAKRLGLVDVVTAAQTITAHVSPKIAEKIPAHHRARFDTIRNPNPPTPHTNSTSALMLRPRTPLFSAANDTPPAGGAAAPVAPPTNVAPPVVPPVITPPANVVPPVVPITLTDITNALQPLQDQITAQQTEITNLRQLQTSGAATASHGAAPVGGAKKDGEAAAPANEADLEAALKDCKTHGARVKMINEFKTAKKNA